MATKDKITRRFSLTRPIMYQGEAYPSADATIFDSNGNGVEGKVFADNNGQYYTLDNNGNAKPVMTVNNLDDTVVIASKPRRLSDAFGKYLTMSNDATKVNNLPHVEYNSHLRDRALEGAASHNAWEKDHPNLSSWGYAASAVPFAVAVYPLAAGLGDVAMSTAAGQAVSNGLIGLANAAKNNTFLPWVDAGATSYFGAQGLQDIQNGNFTPETAMDVAPLVQMAKPVYEAGKGAYEIGKELYDTGALWDKYTTFQGRFGNYGDNLLTNMYGTYARRYGLPDKARLPADAIRKLKSDISISPDGMVNLTGYKGFAGNPHVNTTLDRPVVSHAKGNLDGADTYLFPARDFIGQTKAGSLKSIEPSDMFENGIAFMESPEKVTLISGDVNALNRAKQAGMQTLSSPRLRRIYEEENNAYQNALSSSFSSRFNIVKPPKETLGLSYATEMQRLQSMRGTPTLADFRLLEQQTGLDAGVAPISEYQNAINSLNSMLNPTIEGIINGIVKPYVYPNGREVDFIPDHIEKELNLMQKVPYNKVFYDPASHVEFNWKNSIGLK